MKRNTFHTHTSDAQPVTPSNLFRCSTGRTPQPRADGLGIAIASNADGQRVETMGLPLGKRATQGSRSGVRKTPRPPLATIKKRASKGNTGSRQSMLSKCGMPNKDAALSASARLLACSWITATPKAMSGLCFARRATRFLGGTKRRPKQSSSFRSTYRLTVNNQPCHADVLLELANDAPAPLPHRGDE